MYHTHSGTHPGKTCAACKRGASTAEALLAAQNDSLATLLARMEGILGSVPPDMLRRGRFTHRFFTRSNSLYERSRTVRSHCAALHSVARLQSSCTGVWQLQCEIVSLVTECTA